VKSYLIVARAFLRFLEAHDVDPTTAQISHIRSFLKVQRARYLRRQRREPLDEVDWRSHHTAPIHLLLRLTQGRWPPPSEIGRRLAFFQAHLHAKRYTQNAITAYCIVARRFLAFLQERCVALEQVRSVDVATFIGEELKSYRRRHGRDPLDLVAWRCSLTPAVHCLLGLTQGRWPPPPTHPWFKRFSAHMAVACPCAETRGHYVWSAGQFLAYLQAQGIALEVVEPAHVEVYRQLKLSAYRKRHGRPPKDLSQWRWSLTIPIHRLLRLVHGHWPPPASPHPELERLQAALLAGWYRPSSRDAIECVARRFLDYLRDQGVQPEQVQPSHVESYIQRQLNRYGHRHGHQPPEMATWRRHYTRATRRLLCVVQGCWPPPPPPPTTRQGQLCRELREGFRRWVTETRGLSELTFDKDWGTAGRFLEWLGDRVDPASLGRLAPGDLDAFLAWRTPGLRRATRTGVCQGLRSFLRYLHAVGVIERDLSRCVTSPPRYWNEDIPSTFTDAQVKAVLASAREDRTAAGRRDYAILLLLATYGLRAGEITRLRLEDIDWRRERFRITQSKTGRSSQLPLMAPVGEAILDYLRHGRPKIKHRQVFLLAKAPYHPFARGSCLTSIVYRHLQRAGITVAGKHGPHAFRYARAVSLLRGAVPLKAITDLLGHSSSSSTDVYLKLATDDLRDVGLELPQEVAP
jgi:site-specific recombinase XerD